MYRIPFNQGWGFPHKLWKNLSPRHLQWYLKCVYQRYAYGVSDYDAMDFDEYLIKMLVDILPQYRNDASEYGIVRCLQDKEWKMASELCMPEYDEWLQQQIDTIQEWIDFNYAGFGELEGKSHEEIREEMKVWTAKYDELKIKRNNALKALIDELETFTH